MKRQAFDLQKAISEAWTFIWAERAKTKDHRSDVSYITASDIEAQVRTFAIEQRDGKSRGSMGLAFGKPMCWPPMRISTGSGRDLLGICRDWLLSEVHCGRIESHNFGRGHISGMRFRPKGTAITETEKKTMAAKAASQGKPRPMHYREPGKATLFCQAGRKRFGWRPSKAWDTRDKSRVTCARCLKLLAQPACEEA